MASTSFLLSSHTIGRRPSAIPPPPIVRISAGIATLARGNQKAYQNSSLYELLGVQSSATFKEIKSAYRKLAKVLHPDVAAHDHGEGYRASSEDFRRVNAAYATLSDPEKRSVYDSLLFRRGHMVSSASYYPMVTRPWRNWETDQCW